MKKIITLAMLFLGLASCGSKKDEQKAMSPNDINETILVQAEKEWMPYYEEAVKRVNVKYPNAKIEIKEIASFDHIGIIDKTDAINADVADVFAAPLDRINRLNDTHVLASFDAKALADEIGGFEKFDSGLGGQLKMDGKYIGFPFNIETLVLAINNENAKRNGIDVNNNVDFAKLSPDVAMIPLFNAWWGVSVTNAFDVELLGKDGDKFFSTLSKDFDELTADQQKLFEGLFNYWKQSNEKKLPLFDLNAVYGYMDSQFETGKNGSARIVGPWEIGSIANITKDNYDVFGLDKAQFEGKTLKHWKGGWALVINARNEENESKMLLAKEVIKEIMNPEFAADFYKITGKIMPNVSKEQYMNTSLSDLDKKVIASVLDSFEVSVSRPLFQEWGQVWDTWQNALLSWESKKPKDVREAYKEVQASFKGLLTNLGQ